MNKFQSFLNEAVKRHEPASNNVVAKRLVETWKKTKLLNGLSEKDASDLAMLLQNQAKQLLKEASRTSTAAGSEEWHDIALPVVRKVFVEGNAKKLIYTQSIDKPTGVVFFLDFQVNDNKPSAGSIYNADESVYGTTNGASDPSGGFYGANRFSYSMNYQSNQVLATTGSTSATWDELGYRESLSASVAASTIFKLTVPTSALSDPDNLALASFVFNTGSHVDAVLRDYTKISGANYVFYYTSGSAGTVPSGSTVNVSYTKQPTPEDRGDFESGQAGVSLPTELNIKLTNTTVVAKTRWLKSQMTPELIQDLKAYHTMDAQKEVVNIMSQFLTQEEDLEILEMLSQAAPIKKYWSAQIGRFVNATDGTTDTDQATFTLSPSDWYRTLGIRMNEVAYEIQKRTLRGRANWAVVSPKVAALIQSFETFRSNESPENTYTVGLQSVGSISNQFKVYSNPYWKENEILLGFKGSSFLDSGAAYLNYIPYMMTPPITSFQDASIHQFIQTRNAKVVTRPEFYAKILVQDLASFG